MVMTKGLLVRNILYNLVKSNTEKKLQFFAIAKTEGDNLSSRYLFSYT